MTEYLCVGDDLKLMVLNASCNLESRLSNVLKSLLQIKSDKPKTLGFEGSALSLSTKVDLLYDLGWLDESDYKALRLFMEIRNKFIHNMNANKFHDVFAMFKDNACRNKLLQMDISWARGDEYTASQLQSTDSIVNIEKVISAVLSNKSDQFTEFAIENVYYFRFLRLQGYTIELAIRLNEKLLGRINEEYRVKLEFIRGEMYEMMVSMYKTAFMEFAMDHAKILKEKKIDIDFESQMVQLVNKLDGFKDKMEQKFIQ